MNTQSLKFGKAQIGLAKGTMRTDFNSLVSRQCAFTILESMVAMGIVAVAMAAVMLANSHQLKMVKSDRDTNAATLCLQERAEQLRICNWLKVTDADYVANTLFASRPLSAAPLGRMVERLTIRDYNPDPEAAPRAQMIVEKQSGAPPRIIERGEALQNERLGRADLQVSWTRRDGSTRRRATSTVISNVGISRLALPGFGGTDGLPPITDNPPPEETTEPIEVINPVATPAPTATPKRNGQGTVGGGKGKDQ